MSKPLKNNCVSSAHIVIRVHPSKADAVRKFFDEVQQNKEKINLKIRDSETLQKLRNPAYKYLIP